MVGGAFSQHHSNIIQMSRITKKRERNICSIENCRSYREAHIWPEPLTFHEFPADLVRRKQWLQIIGKEDWIPGDKAKICAAHFTPENYRISETASAQKRLLMTAVPTLNLVLEPLPKTSNGATNKAGVAYETVTTASGSTEIVQCVNCAVPNCWQHREASLWAEPVIFFDFPANEDTAMKWEKALEDVDWVPSVKAKICSVHFSPGDFWEQNARMLKPTAVPHCNMKLKKLGEVNQERPVRSRTQIEEEDPSNLSVTTDSRKRFSNIIIVDLIKDNKKLKLPERPKQQFSNNSDEGCSACLEMKKDLREVEFQLAVVRKELEEQKKLVEELKKKN